MNATSATLRASYRSAEDLARRRARNFYYAFVVLPSERRRALCAVYAFMRRCDDITDGEAPAETKSEGLRALRLELDEAIAGNCGDGFYPALHDAVRRFSIPPEYFHWVIDGAEMDLQRYRYETFDDLYRYCFNVASSVGLVCLEIFGRRGDRSHHYDAARGHAEHCGIAFQLTNILRDVKEDAAMGRIYLPQEDLRRFAYTEEELRRGVFDARFRELMRFEAARATRYYDDARKLLPLVDEVSRPALWAMMEIYGRVLGKIARRQFDVFGGAIRLSNPEKASIALQALVQRLFAGGLGTR